MIPSPLLGALLRVKSRVLKPRVRVPAICERISIQEWRDMGWEVGQVVGGMCHVVKGDEILRVRLYNFQFATVPSF